MSYALAAEVVLVPVDDGSARVLDLQGQFFALSAVAAHMLRDVLERGPAGAVDSTVVRWGVDRARAQADVDTFLADLLKQGLLVPVGQPPRPPRLRVRFAGWLLALLLRVTPGLRRHVGPGGSGAALRRHRPVPLDLEEKRRQYQVRG